MDRTSAEVARLIHPSGWTLLRTPVAAASRWQRWRVTIDHSGETFGFDRILDVEAFWQRCFHNHLAMDAHAEALARWRLSDEGTRSAIDHWLADPRHRLPHALDDRLKRLHLPSLPPRWRRLAAGAGRLSPPSMGELASRVRTRMVLMARERLDAALPRANKASSGRQRL